MGPCNLNSEWDAFRPDPEGLYKSKLQNSARLRTAMALYDQEVARNNGTLNYQQLKLAVKLHNDQMMRNRTSESGTMLWNEDHLSRVKGETTLTWKGKWQYVHWKTHGQCSKGDSCSFSHESGTGNSGGVHIRKGQSFSPAPKSPLETRATVRDEERDRLLPRPIRRQIRLTARNINTHWDQAVKMKTRETRVKFHDDLNSVKSVM